MSFTESIQGFLDADWTAGMGLEVLRGLYFAYFVIDLGPVQIASAQVFTTSREKSS